jgi:5,10-methenyltetrahydromethanopterin hydrogenase
VLARPGVVQQPIETVLVQARASGRTVASDPELRQAVRQVAAALAALPKTAIDVRSPFTAGGHGMISRDGRSALVTFTVVATPSPRGHPPPGVSLTGTRATAILSASPGRAA